ncbi:MAG: hypothetical protein E7566_01325 [Ruminococcaceae bacterium]|nr:hypothetical protein [Oscillospiraceae bacterium]
MKKTYWGNRDIIGMKFGNFFRKYRVDFIRKRSILFGVLAMIICFDAYLISLYTDTSQAVCFGVFAVSVVTFVLHLIFKNKMNFVGYIVIVGVYINYMMTSMLHIANSLDREYTIADLRFFYFVFEDMGLLVFDFVVIMSFALTLCILLFIIECLLTKRNEKLNIIAEGSVLYITEDKLYGVALNDKNAHYDFELDFNEIANVKNIVFEKDYKGIVNLVVTDKRGKEYGLSLNDELGAREEIKYIIKEIALGNAPYPKKSCDSCGFYLIDGRCPNCQKPNTLF